MAKDKIDIAGVVLRDEDGRYLLVQEAKPHVYGLWNWPAGHVDEGETLAQAAIREAKEEVGLDVKILNQELLFIGQGNKKGHVVHSFYGEIIGGKLNFQKNELLDAKWFSVNEIKKLDKAGKTRNPWVIESILKVEKNENSRH